MTSYSLDAEGRSVTFKQDQSELWFRSNRRIKKVNPDEILYCEYSDGCINVVLLNGCTIRVYNFLSQLENKLEETNYFFRIQRNKLVNLRQIKKIDKTTRRIRLTGNLVLNITPGRLEELELTQKSY